MPSAAAAQIFTRSEVLMRQKLFTAAASESFWFFRVGDVLSHGDREGVVIGTGSCSRLPSAARTPAVAQHDDDSSATSLHTHVVVFH